jgi:hypothetical protein
MNNVQNPDIYINIPSLQAYIVVLICWARSGDVMCFLRDTDKPIALR